VFFSLLSPTADRFLAQRSSFFFHFPDSYGQYYHEQSIEMAVSTLLLLDRGLFSIEVIDYLKRSRIPFLVPVMFRGRKPTASRPKWMATVLGITYKH